MVYSGIKSGQRMAKGYSDAGASYTRRALKGFRASSGSPNEDINWNNKTLRQRCRMLYMSTPLATSAINTNRTKVVGTGLTLQCAIDRETLGLSSAAAKQWQRTTQAEVKLWADKKQNCDATGINNFYGQQQLALISWLQSGDAFALIKLQKATRLAPYSLRLHLIEADRISTPTNAPAGHTFPTLTDGRNPSNNNKIFDGVEVDKDGKIVAYHICNTYPGQLPVKEKIEWTRVEAYGKETGLPNILHIMASERCGQYRGVPYLAQVIEPLLQLRRYTESELMAALVQSFFTAWIITDTDVSRIPMDEVGAGVVEGLGDREKEDIPLDENEYGMGPGTVLHLEDGEDVKFGSPNIPTSGFETFVKSLSRMIGAALEIPYEVLIKEFNKSYSAARASLLEAWEYFKTRREWLIDDFCQPVYEIWLAEAVARGRVKAPGFFDNPAIRAAWCGARWIGRVQSQLDPLKEVKAAVTTVNSGFKTHEQITREMGGGDWDNNVEQLKLENENLRAAGGGINIAKKRDPKDNNDGDDAGNNDDVNEGGDNE